MGTLASLMYSVLSYSPCFSITYSMPLYPNAVQPGTYNVQLRYVCMSLCLSICPYIRVYVRGHVCVVYVSLCQCDDL